MKLLKTHKTFGGKTQFWEHDSVSTKTKMKFSTFTPEGPVKGALVWLSGLTCTDENFITKAGAQKHLNDAGLMVICPDTSPRGLNLPGEHEADDFGSGAGFYLNATTPGYKDHYRMYDYVVNEIYGILQSEFKAGDNIGIFGHSMGGHGALVIGLREPKFKTVSVFAPIVNPSAVPWGEKAFTGYLGSDKSAWAQYDATELVRAGKRVGDQGILVDQGSADGFLEKQLKPQVFQSACEAAGQKLKLRLQDGYDHSYYFMSSFIEDHIKWHAAGL